MRKNQCGISKFSSVDTPFGSISVNSDLNNMLNLADSNMFSYLSTIDDLEEHSLELQYPFISNLFDRNDLKILPVQIGIFFKETERTKAASILMDSISNFYKENEVIFVISSDFCHFGKRFDYTPVPTSISETSIDEYVRTLDLKAFEAINNDEESIKSFSHYINETSNTICGKEAILLYLEIIKYCKIKGKWDLLEYEHSSVIKSSTDHSVSYLSAIYHEND